LRWLGRGFCLSWLRLLWPSRRGARTRAVDMAVAVTGAAAGAVAVTGAVAGAAAVTSVDTMAAGIMAAPAVTADTPREVATTRGA